MMHALRALTLLGAALVIHCGSDAQPPPDAAPADAAIQDTGPRPDGGVIGTPDGGTPPAPTITVSGTVLSLELYLGGQSQPVTQVELSVLGVQGVGRVMTDASGNYSVQVPQNGKVVLKAAKTGYRSTYVELSVAAAPITGKNLYLASDAYVTQIGNANAVNVLAAAACHPPNSTALQCRYAVVMGRVVDDGSYDNGTPTPLAGIAAADFTVKGEGDEAWYKKGPYFLSPTGVAGAGITATQRERDPVTNKYRGGLYVIFVEVPITGNPPKEFEIQIASLAGGTVQRQFGPVLFKAFNGGLSWVTLPETGQAPPPPPVIENVNFETQVYPLFLPVNQGGLGCQGCHTNQGGAAPSGGLNLYGGPAAAYAALNPAQYPERVNVQTPAESYLLKRPLYEADGNQDHPIFAFVSENDPAYQLVYAWIGEGAQLQGVVDPPVSFYNQIRPLLYQPAAQGGIGCYDCHVNGVDAVTAPGGLYMGGNGNELFAELTQETPSDNGQTGELYRINKTPGGAALSLVLLNPLLGSIEPHPAKLLQGTNDARYQLIYRWINQGYLNDTP